jgi:uncharacterized protein YutE (UPF0331/DUF86 family)
VDTDLLLTKIESLRKCIARIEEKRPADSSILHSDLDLQDIISVNLERAVQQCVDIAAIIIADTENPPPATMSSSFTMLAEYGYIDHDLSENLRSAVGFRNIAVHEYYKIDWEIVFSIISNSLDDFRKFAAVVMSIVDTSPLA